MRIRRHQGLIALVAGWGVLLFLLIVVFEDVVNPSLDPARHEISEYVHTPWGWLMVVGFVAWALSLLCTGIAARTRYGADVLCITLAVAALGMAITACFATQTSAGRLPPGVSLSTSGRLHDIGSGLATVALFFAALLSLRLRAGAAFRRVTLALLVLACSSDVGLLEVGGSAGGIRQRILVLIGCAWQLAMLTVGAADSRV
jgi:hypothetical protein